MAIERTFVNHSDYADSDSDFSFQTVDDNIYLQIGDPNEDDERLIVSIISGGFVGFFQDDEEEAFAEITADYDSTNGIRVDEIPSELVTDDEYIIKFTQARPGDEGVEGYSAQLGQADLGDAGPRWTGLPPVVEIYADTPETFSFSNVFELAGQTADFEIQITANKDGTGGVPSQLNNIVVTTGNLQFTVDARLVLVNVYAYYRINAIIRGTTPLANILSGRVELRVLQRTAARWSSLPVLTVYEGISMDLDFSSYLTEGIPPSMSYGVETALNSDGTGDLPSALTNLATTIPTGTTFRANATTVTLSGTSDEVLYYRLSATAPGTDTVYSLWTMMTIKNAYAASWNTIDDQSVFEGASLALDFSSVFTDGAPMTPSFVVSLFGAATGSGGVTDTDLDTELTATVDDTTQTVTFNADNVDVSSDKTVWFEITAQQPDPS